MVLCQGAESHLRDFQIVHEVGESPRRAQSVFYKQGDHPRAFWTCAYRQFFSGKFYL